MSDGSGDRTEAQLAALRRLHALTGEHGIACWVFGGWAVDLHLGRVTRAHDDVDVAVRVVDLDLVRRLLVEDGWAERTPTGAQGWTTFVRADVSMDVALLDEDPATTPGWPPRSFGDDVGQVGGTRARVVGRASLVADKTVDHHDAAVLAKDRADVARLLAGA